MHKFVKLTYRVVHKKLVSKFYNIITSSKQDSHVVARKPRDAAAVLYGLKFADNIHTSLRVAKLRKPGFIAPNIPAQKRI